MNERELVNRLSKVYGEREARAIVRLVLEVSFGLSLTDIVCGSIEKMSAEETQKLSEIMSQLEQGMPVQYVLGVADFGPRSFHVEPGVLIPRPETYELCQMVVKDVASNKNLPSEIDILDVGTGSGCIAITLALDIPQAHVTGWDISPEALRIAARNAEALSADITFEQRDFTASPPLEPSTVPCVAAMPQQAEPPTPSKRWSIIISNPPYVTYQERSTMARHVLDYEPEIALFVPDDDPLVCYRYIARYAMQTLVDGGWLYFEVNPLYASDLQRMMEEMGWHETTLHNDQFGKKRFMKCKK
ncbi:MAG: peptide chain release factor N(5)-glutamine methyltransferase [Prevotella sp.]|nr:peptide chain release factor N(5)-glutamine methyltransferase [Prevotella sp.]